MYRCNIYIKAKALSIYISPAKIPALALEHQDDSWPLPCTRIPRERETERCILYVYASGIHTEIYRAALSGFDITRRAAANLKTRFSRPCF